MDFHIPYHTYQAKYGSKYAALYHALHDNILANKLLRDTKLPSSRELAALYGLSRGTVNQVYDMLIAEGYLQADVGRGTYVVYNGGQEKQLPFEGKDIRLSDWGARVCEADRDGHGKRREQGRELELERGQGQEQEQRQGREREKRREQEQERGQGQGENQGQSSDQGKKIAFVMGRPHLDEFPRELWNRGMYEQVRRMTESPQEEAYVAEGHYALREAIAQHLRRIRGIDAPPESIVIVNGSMQAIALLTQMLVNEGDPVILERPGYQGASRAVLAAGGVPIHAPVDEQGLVPQPWNARLLFVTPSRQFPTGAVLGLERRQQLLRWAAEQGAVIVEDDYDSEFRHRGRPIEPLKVLDQEGRVVYIGTFSKTMLQDLRIGYVVLPEALHDAFVAAKRLYEPHPSGLLEQRSLAAFMGSGGYERHLRRMRRVYASKFLLLQALLQEQLSTLFDWVESDAGLHLFGWWRGDPRTYAAYAAECRKIGVTWSDAGSYGIPPGKAGACFGFAHLTEQEIRQGVAALREVSEIVIKSTI
ncbi:PLP-dependent aminotransferase family protein [Paenibacillus chondroitinus]|uniref:PLP-dependent aminotransferase family protein n=1 Tax=Paenibacillus chondroitinus TaxID=59842 RepID=A0ABU6DFT9_9BACL|nr:MULTISPECIES: PLP-dependent aminotransferase family protein [Paenibacillus]MCY9658879.1 PLP-dependent aminotransferase family protein [Paenibacillus anseongense]MEB4795741.1 PLP-dependent aminotransferase family protein [Paenibacillus chondroitinus]